MFNNQFQPGDGTRYTVWAYASTTNGYFTIGAGDTTIFGYPLDFNLANRVVAEMKSKGVEQALWHDDISYLISHSRHEVNRYTCLAGVVWYWACCHTYDAPEVIALEAYAQGRAKDKERHEDLQRGA